jgi:hypothetical protein
MAVTPAGNADGTVYASFMLSRGSQYYPVVDASFDHGAAFTQSSSLIPPDPPTRSRTDVVASWGSDYPDVSGNHAEIYAANVAVAQH